MQSTRQQDNIHGAHRADIETKKPTANNRNGGDAVDIADLIHGETLDLNVCTKP